MIMKEDMYNVIILLIALIIFCWAVVNYAEEEKQTVKEVSGHKILELEDGHWYLRSGRGALEHYIECPKCNKKE